MSLVTEMGISHRNYKAFKEILAKEPRILQEHFGRVALLHDGKIVQYLDSATDARRSGEDKFGLGEFSIQRIGSLPVDLGYFSSVRSL